MGKENRCLHYWLKYSLNLFYINIDYVEIELLFVVALSSHVKFVLRFYGPVNSYGHVEPVSYPLTLFLGRLRPTNRFTST